MPGVKRAAMYCPGCDDKVTAEKQSRAYAYAQAQGYVLTRCFQTPEEILESREDFDVIISVGESTPLPMVGVEFVTI